MPAMHWRHQEEPELPVSQPQKLPEITPHARLNEQLHVSVHQSFSCQTELITCPIIRQAGDEGK